MSKRAVPLTQKWRPGNLSELVGQRTPIAIIKGMLGERGVPPTILISGPRAVGKTTIARILARALNCSKPTNNGPCGKCQSCQEPDHPDVVEMNAASDRGIDTVRKLAEVIRLAPSYNTRVYIIDEVHQFTRDAFNASLKILEEPPETVCFLLVTTDPDRIPETILSRCSKITLNTIPEKAMTEWLLSIAKAEKFKLSKEVAPKIASASGGHPREALTILEQVMNHPGSAKKLRRVVDDIIGSSADGSVNEFIKAVIEANIESAFTLCGRVEVPDQFLGKCVDVLRALVRFQAAPKTCDMCARTIARNIGLKKPPSMEDLTIILRAFATNYQQAKTYMVPAHVLLDLAILESMPAD